MSERVPRAAPARRPAVAGDGAGRGGTGKSNADATRRALSPEDFIAATLELVDAHGVDAVSMRRVAEHLGVSPMAAYRHFRDKEELLVRALDAFAGRAELLPLDSLAWDDWVRAVARTMHEALAAHPGWIPLLGSLRLGQHAAAATRAFVERLVAEGFTPERALRAWFAVNQVVIGAVCMGGPLLPPPADAPAPSAAGPRGAGPVAHEMAAELRAIGPVAQLDIGLEFILEALEAERTPDGRRFP
ncbi:MAG TPA: helix-turn-helix domain-containing protein [Pseudomonadales bacterium]|nr:helix-turn-helix domain-containing protein [Pseudomonadales bacterium]